MRQHDIIHSSLNGCVVRLIPTALSAALANCRKILNLPLLPHSVQPSLHVRSFQGVDHGRHTFSGRTNTESG